MFCNKICIKGNLDDGIMSANVDGISIHKAQVKDIPVLKSLIDGYVKNEQMLPRSMSELYESTQDFFVCTDKGEVVACCALKVRWDELAEIASLAVRQDHLSQGIGSMLVEACIEQAKNLGITHLFTLTYASGFFAKKGFVIIDKAELPHKIWADCIRCPKFPNCDETAMELRI